MRKNLLKLLLATVCLLGSTSAWAYDIEINGIYYDVVSFTDLTCKVVNNGKNGTYGGDIVISSTINHNDRTLTVVGIGANAFNNSSNLISVTLPNTITSIDSYAFAMCDHLTSMVLPNSVLEIGDYAFSGCNRITSINIPNSVTKIGNYAFRNCSGLTSMTLPNSVMEVGNNAFSGCTNLASITLPRYITKIGNDLFSGCTSLTSVSIPNSVTSIGQYAFSNCTNLTDVIISDSVKTINSYAFKGCSALTNVTIGKAVDYIYTNAFNGCDKLTTLYSLNLTPPRVISGNFTSDHYMNTTVYVPQEALEAYRNADPWKNFWSLQEYDESGNKAGKCAKPTIRYTNNTLAFDCETEGVIYETKITDADMGSYNSREIRLGVTYNISVYATKIGYEDSDVATATLCWIDVEPKTEGVTDAVAQVRANAVLIQSNNGQVDVSGVDDGTKVAVYGVNGAQVGSAVSSSGHATINTSMAPGSIVIVKIGDRSVKVVVR